MDEYDFSRASRRATDSCFPEQRLLLRLHCMGGEF